MSAILAKVLPDFSEAAPPPAPTPPRVAPFVPTRVVRLPSAGRRLEASGEREIGRAGTPLRSLSVPEAMRALQALVQPAGPQPAAPASTMLGDPWAGLRRRPVTPPASPSETPAERAALLAEAEARGREAGLAEARAEAAAALAAERESLASRLAEERARWCENEAERLGDSFAAALRTRDEDLTQRIGRLLVPVLGEALRRRALDDLAGTLESLFCDASPARIRVTGPDDLLAGLRRRLGALGDAMSFEPGPAPDVTVMADHTVIETRLNAWIARLADAAGGA